MGQLLVASCWDGTIFTWKIAYNEHSNPKAHTQLIAQQRVDMPVLGLCWQIESPGILFACADNNIKRWDLQTNQMTVVGQHAQPVKDIANINISNNSVVISGGWDGKVKFWTWRNGLLNDVGEAYVAMPVHYMDCRYPLLVTAHQDRFIHIWDLEKTF